MFCNPGVTHGSYVAIRASNTYLRCPTWSYYCFGSTTYYSGRGADSVFQIYHPYGPGPIRVGDFVGLYSPPNRKWFSMYQGSGHKQSCPGSPRYWWSGFSSYSHWFYCGSEVFRIYARGRGPGQEIRSGDTISLHSSSRGGFLRVSNKCFPHVSTCLQRYWHNQNYAYSVCHGEAFQIYIR